MESLVAKLKCGPSNSRTVFRKLVISISGFLIGLINYRNLLAYLCNAKIHSSLCSPPTILLGGEKCPQTWGREQKIHASTQNRTENLIIPNNVELQDY